MSTTKTRKTANLETIVGRMYRTQGTAHGQYWALAEWAAKQEGTQAVIAGRITAALKDAAPAGAPVIRISQSTLSQMLNALKVWGDNPDARHYHPALLYRYCGKSGNISEYERKAAEAAQGRSKRAMKNGGKGDTKPTSDAVDVKDAALSDVMKRLHKLAKALNTNMSDLLSEAADLIEEKYL